MKTHPPEKATLKFAMGCNQVATISCRTAPVEIKARDYDHGSYEWIHLVPNEDSYSLETVPGVDGGVREAVVKTVFNRAVRDALIENFESGRLLDFEHSDQSSDPASSTEAAGWIEELRAVNDGIDAKIDWSDRGESSVQGKRYRFVSPVLTGRWDKLDAKGTVEDPVLFYPKTLDEAGLTNRPKLAGKLRSFFKENSPGQPAPANPKNEMKYKQELAKLLGVDETIADDQLQAKVVSFSGELATLKNKAGKTDELQAKVDTLEGDRLDHDLERFKDVITDKESARALFKADRASAIKIFQGTLDAKTTEKPPHTKIHNRGKIVDPDDQASAADGKAARIANRAAAISSEKALPLSVATRQAEAELGG